jgi:arylsulfatase A-like enzyme
LLLALAALTGCGGGTDDPEPRSGLLITIDTTRVDSLSCLGGVPGTTPVLDALAAEGVLYERARTVAPLTLPAHASMLTGLTPLRHGFRDNGLIPLSTAAQTLAESAAEKGVQSAAFVGAVVLDDVYRLDQGFDHYDAPGRDTAMATAHYAERPANEVVDGALAWLEQRDRERPFLLWVHFYDPHLPYDPPRPFLLQAGGDAYRGEVRFVDAQIGRLVEFLRADGAWDDTAVVFVSDHGEALGEHGEETHGSFCWDSTIRVPLIVRDPGGGRAGERSREVVSVVDVYPTLADAMGLSVPPGLDGVTLLRPALDAERTVYFESYYGFLSYGWSPLAGVADARTKYLQSSAPQLFETGADPGETRDLYAERPDEVARLRRALALFASLEALPATDERVEGGVLSDIESLGYAGGGEVAGGFPNPLEPSTRPAPRHAIGEQHAIQRARAQMNAGHPEQAATIVAAVLAKNPENWIALDLFALSLLRRERMAEARPAFERLLANGPQWPGSWHNLGLCRRATGDPEAAVQAFRRALEIDRGQSASRTELVALLRELGRDAEADEAERAGRTE